MLRRALFAFSLCAHAALAQTPVELERAEALAAEALVLYERGETASAASLFEQAYELSKKPAPLRNAARAHQTAGTIDRAIELWERYAAHPEVPADKRAQAERTVADLRAELAVVQPLAPSQPQPAPDPPPPVASVAPPIETVQAPAEPDSVLTQWWFWAAAGAAVLVGTGAALVGTGAFTERRLCHGDPSACPP